jgi:hypothetical protein
MKRIFSFAFVFIEGARCQHPRASGL